MENVIRWMMLLLDEVKGRDPLHYKTLRPFIESKKGVFWDHLCSIIYNYTFKNNIGYSNLVEDYFSMIRSMRKETMGKKDDDVEIFEDNMVKTSYLNALLLSQILWEHHYKILQWWHEFLVSEFKNQVSSVKVIDIGAGHGMFSKILTEDLSDFSNIDIVDISRDSLEFTRKMLYLPNISYHETDIEKLRCITEKYNIIIMGEVLEHLVNPLFTLTTIRNEFLDNEGFIWLTVPTNSPAIDHIQMFSSEMEIISMVEDSGLNVVNYKVFDVKGSQTKMVAIIAVK